MDTNNFIEFFKKVTGFEPYKYQIDLAESLLGGNNILLQAPTGSGKTWGAITPFLYAMNVNHIFPQKLIYSLPLRTLTNSLYQTVHNNPYIKELNRNQKIFGKQNSATNDFVRIQTGEITGDLFLEGEMIFTTIDQTLSSVLEFPLSLPHKLANINAGAIVGSYLVFDEFHLFDTSRAFSTTINILKKLKNVTPFCLMTATVSNDLLKGIASETNAKIIRIENTDIQNIQSQKAIKTIYTNTEPLNGNIILERHKNKSIVICNTVDRCQEIYLELKKQKNNQTELLCIHSRFFGSDRNEIEKRINDIFKKNSVANAILVSTQVIEVGLDISCEVIHTETSPINSFFQRIGRCARYENEIGEIYLYLPKSNDKGELHFYPYETKNDNRMFSICRNTFEELNKINGQILSYHHVERLTNQILGEKEIQDFESLRASSFNDRIINNSYTEKKKSFTGELIREVNTKNVALINNYVNNQNLYNYETLSVGYYTLLKHLKGITENESFIQGDDWITAKIDFNNGIGFIDEIEGDNRFRLTKCPMEEVKYEPLFFLNSKFSNYSSEIGLNFIKIGDRESNIKHKREQLHEYKLQKDTYQQHIAAMIKCYEVQFQGQLRYTFEKLNIRLRTQLDFDQLIKLMIILHDYGKLNKTWQSIVHQYQSKKMNYKSDEILAHTDFDYSESDRESMQKLGKLPPHAGIGALISLVILDHILDENLSEQIGSAIATSIIEHHTVNSENTGAYEIGDKERQHVFGLIDLWAKEYSKFDKTNSIFTNSKSEKIRDLLVKPDDNIKLILYLLFARILRLCDQKSFAYLHGKN